MQPARTADKPHYLNHELPLAERLADLLGRLTLDEKISLMTHKTPGVPRLGIPGYNYWSEALHGVARNGRATVFPQAIGLAATWDADLVERVASAIGDEARVKFHAALRANGRNDYNQGLTFWSPNVNLFRDPRWGRGQETWGEDPLLTGTLGSAFVRGLQGNHPKYLKAAACAKHYAVHSGPEQDRHHFNARVSARELYDTYLPAFKQLVTEAKVEAVMGAYNRTLDEPCSASQRLLGDILRGEWGFDGHVVSDCGALSDIHEHHHLTRDAVETAALAIRRGCDLECGDVYKHLGEAVARGLLTEADIDRSLARTLRTRFKLGLFDPPEVVPYAHLPASLVGGRKHRQLAHTAAARSIVLLKNAGGLLPVPASARTLFVVGPTAASVDVLLGNYYGLNDQMITFIEGIVAAAPEGMRVNYLPGCQLVHANLNPQDWAFGEARAADLTIACFGLTAQMEGEEGSAILSEQNGDRARLTLPDVQVEYLKALAQRTQRLVLVLSGGSAIELGGLEELAQAIVMVWYPGQAGGSALADVLFGRTAPSGRLPITFPRSVDDLPPYDDYAMDRRTYRYATAEPLFPFGFGLSYVRFAYSDLSLSRVRLKAGQPLRLTVQVTNQGDCDAEEVVQAYLSDREASVLVPRQRLVGFRRVRLKAGRAKRVSFTLSPALLSLVADDGRARLEPGWFDVTVGGSAPGARAQTLGAAVPVAAAFEVLA